MSEIIVYKFFSLATVRLESLYKYINRMYENDSMITTIFSKITFEMMLLYAIVAMPVLIWGFLKMKKDHPNECSRYIILSFIPLIYTCTFDTYCRQTRNISDNIKLISLVSFIVSAIIIVVTFVIVTYISYKQKNEYYETLKRRKPIFLTCGIGVLVCIVFCLFIKYVL